MRQLVIFTLIFITGISSIGIPLQNGQRCMLIQGGLDPIKLQVKFPMIPEKKQGEKFRIVLMEYVSEDVLFEGVEEEGKIYRKNLALTVNVLYHFCIELETYRTSFGSGSSQLIAEYKVDEDFDALIGSIEVPDELRGEANLQFIYRIAESVNHLDKKIESNQEKQRQIEENIAVENLKKNERITTLTIIQCLTIVLSGIYQIVSLKRFLAANNLY